MVMVRISDSLSLMYSWCNPTLRIMVEMSLVQYMLLNHRAIVLRTAYIFSHYIMAMDVHQCISKYSA